VPLALVRPVLSRANMIRTNSLHHSKTAPAQSVRAVQRPVQAVAHLHLHFLDAVLSVRNLLTAGIEELLAVQVNRAMRGIVETLWTNVRLIQMFASRIG